ncbi:MAG: hypothetical protein JSV81_12460 [Anaerolineales bacterium]|nr:MAG: hypothetical protein JSV81_12460 [Anaerolineales bacterium]
MHNQQQQSGPVWGMRLHSRAYGEQDYPSWANRAQREKWCDRGLIVWDDKVHQVARLSATQAIGVLDYTRSNDDWKTQGIVVGEPAIRMVLDEPDREPEDVLVNQIELNATQSQELFDYLRNNEARLRELSQVEEREIGEALGRVYRYAIERARKNRAGEEEKATPDSEL